MSEEPHIEGFPARLVHMRAKLLNQFFKENECEWPLERVADFKRTRRRILNRYYARRSRKKKKEKALKAGTP